VTVVVLAPLRIEALALRGLDVRRTGMGARRADVSGADSVVVAGFCGGVDPSLRAGDVVLADELRSEDGAKPCLGEDLAPGLERRGLRVRTGPIYSAGHILGPNEREQLRSAGVLAVDMESYWLADSAGHRPLVVLRVVVDEAGRRLLSPRTLPAGVRAFRALRRAGTVVSRTEFASDHGRLTAATGSAREP
jgi:4-hydroxy-3-methylbut-2-enyl diphosphate reductase